MNLACLPFSLPHRAPLCRQHGVHHSRWGLLSARSFVVDAEAEINDHVFRLFNLTPDEIKLLMREVEH